MKYSHAAIVRFLSHIQIPTSGDGCWLWELRPNAQGYGRASMGGRSTELAHHVSFKLFGNALAAGECVLHRCDVRLCVNPNHLFKGDRGDNARDMAAKGRQFLQQHPERAKRGADHPRRQLPRERFAHGATHPNATLTEAQVIEIRERVAGGEAKSHVARRFGISPFAVGWISSGEGWPHVGGPRTPFKRHKRRRDASREG